MIKKDWDGYRAKYEVKFGIFLRIMLSGGQKHHFTRVYQILRKILRAQNRNILEGLLHYSRQIPMNNTILMLII